MIALLEIIGPAIWRASWQATVLALVVAVLLRCLGERVSPRWRFLLYGVILLRFLLVVTPESRLSVFNIASWNRKVSTHIFEAQQENGNLEVIQSKSDAIVDQQKTKDELRTLDYSSKESSKPTLSAFPQSPTNSTSSETAAGFTSAFDDPINAVYITRFLSSIWLIGCLLSPRWV